MSSLDLITPSVSDSCVEKISLCVATTGWVRREDLEICEISCKDLEGSLLALLGLKEPRCGSKGIAGTNSGYPAITGGRSGKDTCLSFPPNPGTPGAGPGPLQVRWQGPWCGPLAHQRRSLVWTLGSWCGPCTLSNSDKLAFHSLSISEVARCATSRLVSDYSPGERESSGPVSHQVSEWSLSGV